MKRWFLAALLTFTATALIADVTKGDFGASQDSAPAVRTGTDKESKKPKSNSYPFHGTLAAIDSAGKTLTLEGRKKPRVIAVTAQTRVLRNGAKAKLQDATAGERVTGTVRKNSAGQEEAITIRYASNPPAK